MIWNTDVCVLESMPARQCAWVAPRSLSQSILQASIKTMTEDEAVKKILQEIDDNSVNDGGFYTAIQKLEGVEAAGQGVHQLNTSCD